MTPSTFLGMTSLLVGVMLFFSRRNFRSSKLGQSILSLAHQRGS